MHLQGLLAVMSNNHFFLGLEGVQFQRTDRAGKCAVAKAGWVWKSTPDVHSQVQKALKNPLHSSFHTQPLPSPPASTSESLKHAWKAVFCFLLSSSPFLSSQLLNLLRNCERALSLLMGSRCGAGWGW